MKRKRMTCVSFIRLRTILRLYPPQRTRTMEQEFIVSEWRNKYVTMGAMTSVYRRKNVLVTGGLGFIGSNLVLALVRDGAHVTVVDNLSPLQGGNLFNIESVKDKVKVELCDIRDILTMSQLV